MLNLNDLIEVLYQKHLIDIATEMEDKNLRNRFEKYMKDKYQKFFDRIDTDDSLREKMLHNWFETEERHWGRLSNDAKYAQFTEDVVLVQIDKLSGDIFSLAKRKLQGDAELITSEESLCACINEMKSLENQVFKVNQLTAQKLISEAIVEVDYILKKSTNVSMRIGNIAKYIHN